MDHEAEHPVGFTFARLVTFIPLQGGHERRVVRLASLARWPEGMTLSLNTAQVMSALFMNRVY